MNNDEKRIRDNINKQKNERIFDIDLIKSPYSLRLKITEKESYGFDFNSELLKITFNQNYFDLLEKLLDAHKQELVKLANLYVEKNIKSFDCFLGYLFLDVKPPGHLLHAPSF